VLDWNLDHLILSVKDLCNVEHIWRVQLLLTILSFTFLGDVLCKFGLHNWCNWASTKVRRSWEHIDHAEILEFDGHVVGHDLLSAHERSHYRLHLAHRRSSCDGQANQFGLDWILEHEFVFLILFQAATWRLNQGIKDSLAFVRDKTCSESNFLLDDITRECLHMHWICFNLVEIYLWNGCKSSILHHWFIDDVIFFAHRSCCESFFLDAQLNKLN